MEKMLINGTEKRYTEKRMYAANQAMRVYRRALTANCLPSELSQVYGRCSYEKQYAMQACKNDACGPVFITSHNGFFFNVIYLSADKKYIVTDTGRTERRYPVTWIDKKELFGPVEFLSK